MRKFAEKWLFVLFCWAAFCSPFENCLVLADEPQEIHFHDNYQDALREARLTKKPIFLEFRCAP